MWVLEPQDWNLDIDRYINPCVPRNRISRLPKPISRFLGYRASPREDVGNLLVAAWSFLGAFIGIVVIAAAFMIPAIHDHGAPLLIASFVCRSSQSLKPSRLMLSRVPQPYSSITRLSLLLLSPATRSSDTFSLLLWALVLRSSFH